MPLKLIKHLEKLANDLNWEEKTENYPHISERCEHVFRMFLSQKERLMQSAANIEQLRGMAKQCEMDKAVVGQHKAIYLEQCKKEEITREEFKERADVVDKCITSLNDTMLDKRAEFQKLVGKGEGYGDAALDALKQIEGYLRNLESQKQFMETNPDLFGKPEEKQPLEDVISKSNGETNKSNGETHDPQATLDPNPASPKKVRGRKKAITPTN